MKTYSGLDQDEAADFCRLWLPAWTGNDPDLLISFYAEDAFYSDPALPSGVQGRASLLPYFRRLLARNPTWVWTHEDSRPLPEGFLNYWRAVIPVGSEEIEVRGVCTVILHEGLIRRNEVFFDRPAALSR